VVKGAKLGFWLFHYFIGGYPQDCPCVLEFGVWKAQPGGKIFWVILGQRGCQLLGKLFFPFVWAFNWGNVLRGGIKGEIFFSWGGCDGVFLGNLLGLKEGL